MLSPAKEAFSRGHIETFSGVSLRTSRESPNPTLSENSAQDVQKSSREIFCWQLFLDKEKETKKHSASEIIIYKPYNY